MQELVFNDHHFTLIERDNKTWLSAADIAVALGYSRGDKVSRVYDRHAQEFTASMTMIHQTPSLGHGAPPTYVRLFSLRGAHLIGMFSRTAKGEEFRRWVLDRLDALEAQAIPQRSLMVEWFEAKAAVDSQDRFASVCGKGLNEHKKLKPPLMARLIRVGEKLQPSLCFN